ncbi:BQ5605_C013g07301 [Microbotryum silenes-dioicae]|uniref:BQ5605_C013g07301 protein n=1 Tax=Microbotryum silenes-dioicae TaxID=796604 RepID=A0A2X0LVM6_9BASI|nr:BQ5605_C013g07301 [Microbotryum silenes-dioicae]
MPFPCDAPLWEPSDELVLSKLWPHLDPFGLVGFCVERNLKISLDEQINHLLNLYDSDFDPTQVFRQLAFRVPKEKVARIGAALLEIDMDVVSEMVQKTKDTKRYKATTEAEKQINRILAELQGFGDKLHGTTAQMLDMRNEIRGCVNAFASGASRTILSTKQIPFRPTTKRHLIVGCNVREEDYRGAVNDRRPGAALAIQREHGLCCPDGK